MEENLALEDWEVQAGYVLCCQARPLTAELELHLRRIGAVRRICTFSGNSGKRGSLVMAFETICFPSRKASHGSR